MKPVIDDRYIQRQIDWSEKTFGPGRRTEGLLKHLSSELDEIRDDPGDLYEWIDLIILALDGAWRCGHSPQDIIQALVNKQETNRNREWPDWREFDEHTPIEHVR